MIPNESTRSPHNARVAFDPTAACLPRTVSPTRRKLLMCHREAAVLCWIRSGFQGVLLEMDGCVARGSLFAGFPWICRLRAPGYPKTMTAMSGSFLVCAVFFRRPQPRRRPPGCEGGSLEGCKGKLERGYLIRGFLIDSPPLFVASVMLRDMCTSWAHLLVQAGLF